MNININKSPLAIIPIAIITITLIINYIKNPENIFLLPFIFISAIATVGTTILASKKKKKIISFYNIFDWSMVIFASIFLLILTIYCIYTKSYAFIPISIPFWGIIVIEAKSIIKKHHKEQNKFKF